MHCLIFSENEQTAWMQEEGIFRNLVNGEIVEVKDPVLKGYEFVWMNCNPVLCKR